jgi:cytochrome c oxidase subunit 2
MNQVRQCNSGIIIFVSLLFSALVLSGCQGATSILNPQGEGTQHIANLWWIMLGIATAIYLLVLLYMAIALFRRTRRESSDTPYQIVEPPVVDAPTRTSRLFIVINGIAIPLVILTIVFGLNLNTLAALSPEGITPELSVEVIGHRWWWEVRYPHHSVVTANEIHIPTGTRVELRLSSEDVIHSLWVPELNGKADLIPGASNRMSLYTEQAGEYRGACAELCGVQHTYMLFRVIAHPPDEFEQWIARQQQPASQPQDELTLRGQQIFLGSACVYCHTISGTSATGVIGPDLTHLASRKWLGAGVVPNTRGNLGGWIIDPQGIKPGNLMPPMYLEGDDLQALLTYLESLQ